MTVVTRKDLTERYRSKHGALVQPRQGFASLHSKLHLAYSMGRVRGFTDLGTYVNKPNSDHAGHPPGVMPSWAFDLGRNDRFLFKGWGYIKARMLAKLYWKYHRQLDLDYVILGRRIISRSKPYWHPLGGTDTSHMFHIHVSGYDPDWEEV